MEWGFGGRRYTPPPPFPSSEANLERKYEVKKKNWKSRLIGNLPNPKNHPPFSAKTIL